MCEERIEEGAGRIPKRGMRHLTRCLLTISEVVVFVDDVERQGFGAAAAAAAIGQLDQSGSPAASRHETRGAGRVDPHGARVNELLNLVTGDARDVVQMPKQHAVIVPMSPHADVPRVDSRTRAKRHLLPQIYRRIPARIVKAQFLFEILARAAAVE